MEDPFRTVTNGVNTGASGDIVLIRPGNYDEPMAIRKSITLGATHGNALLGKP
jgi:hypothetical protein